MVRIVVGMQRPSIEIRGSQVIWRSGATTTRYRLSSHAEAIGKAGELEQAFVDDQAARRVAAERRGVVMADAVDGGSAGEAGPAAEPDVGVADEPGESSPGSQPATFDVVVSTSFDVDAERVVVDIDVDTEVELWRRVGAVTSSFVAKPGGGVRRWKASAGDRIEVRVGDADGYLLHEGTV